MRTYRCPKCRTIATRFDGVGTVGETLSVEGDEAQFFRNGDDFTPQYVLATCPGCGHQWRLRGVQDVAGVAEAMGLKLVENPEFRFR